MNPLAHTSGHKAGFHALNVVPLISFCLLLAACGGSGGSKSNEEPKINTDYSNLRPAQLRPEPLRSASATELDNLLKNGLRLSLGNNISYGDMMTASLSKTASTVGFSTTNLQVAGVDEADVVKYDGKHIFVATPVEATDTGAKSHLKIFATEPATYAAREVSDTLLDASYWFNPSELYLVEQNSVTTDVLAIRRSQTLMTLRIDSAKFAADAMIYPMDQGVELSLFDVRTPSAPSVRWRFSFDGDLLGTRKIGNRLYLISRFVPSLGELAYGADTELKRVANENLIRQTQVEKLLPEYRINGGSPQPLGSASNCLVSADTKANDGYLNIISVTVIDLASQQLLESQCLNTPVEGIYASATNLYLGGSSYDSQDGAARTIVHKFALTTAGVGYLATGSVEGTLGWTNSSYFMDEYQGDLRLLTTDRRDWQNPVHQLSILRTTDGSNLMTLVGNLPSKTNPQVIGKPGEDIYAVRFNGPSAYVVTFQRKDPLYVLDLSNASAPAIAGELNIPGFSTYLQPVGDHLLFSLGHEADEQGVITGVKVALFDIRDRSSPKELNKFVYGSAGSSSAALQDFHALSWVQQGADQLRIALPIDFTRAIPQDSWISHQWQKTSLMMYEINGITGAAPSLKFAGEILGRQNEDDSWQAWNSLQRSVLDGDAAYFIYDSKIKGEPWGGFKPL